MSHPASDSIVAQRFLATMGEEVTPAQAKRLARLAVETLLAVQLVTVNALDRFERDAKLYHLRGRGIMPQELRERFNNLSRTQIFEAIRKHGKLRRAALRMAG